MKTISALPISQSGYIHLNKEIRKALGVKPGDTLEVKITDQGSLLLGQAEDWKTIHLPKIQKDLPLNNRLNILLTILASLPENDLDFLLNSFQPAIDFLISKQ